MSHRHYCYVSGHDWQCSDGCACICGLPMEQGDHSDCPVELRACPEHKDETEQQMTARVHRSRDRLHQPVRKARAAASPLPMWLRRRRSRHCCWLLPVVRSRVRELQPRNPRPTLRLPLSGCARQIETSFADRLGKAPSEMMQQTSHCVAFFELAVSQINELATHFELSV